MLVQEIASNIYKIRLPLPFPGLDHMNVYLLQETNFLAMVDTGLATPESWQALKAGLAALNLHWHDLTDIFVTHSHPDHIGQLASIRQEAPAARFHIHYYEYELLEGRATNPEQDQQRLRQWLDTNGAATLVMSGLGSRTRYVPQLGPQDSLLKGGEKVLATASAEWQVQWTPGHTPGHFILHNPTQRLLLSGDHLLGKISSNVGKYPGSTADPLGDYLDSLDRLAALDLAEILPAHGLPFKEYRERIATLKGHHQKRLEQIYSVIEAGGGTKTAAEVVQKIWSHRRLEGFDQYLALFETLSHLERLVRMQQIVAETSHDLIYYRCI
jgi:glyoxylase-like metal-dependent hydrolase (beta-lactamase superfamily II)